MSAANLDIAAFKDSAKLKACRISRGAAQTSLNAVKWLFGHPFFLVSVLRNAASLDLDLNMSRTCHDYLHLYIFT